MGLKAATSQKIKCTPVWHQDTQPGVRQLTGENLEVVWAEFSTLSLVVLFDNTKNAHHANGQI